jgi:hypothetical protein
MVSILIKRYTAWIIRKITTRFHDIKVSLSANHTNTAREMSATATLALSANS